MPVGMTTGKSNNILSRFKFTAIVTVVLWIVSVAGSLAQAQTASMFFQGQVPDLTSAQKNVHQTIASFSDVAAVRLAASEDEVASGRVAIIAKDENGEVLPSKIVRGDAGAGAVDRRPIVLVRLAARAEQIVTLCIGQAEAQKSERCYRYRVLRVDPS